ncbi:MAG: (d)CMP kinase [Candidatus Omnitrophica bacterium]|nr:(d)CMP kinase [Candidatus Omnitrophota bacterium]
MIIAIDGPAGAGKSTIAKNIAKRLGFFYIDTGAMYRALALKAIQEKIDTQDTEKLIKMTAKTKLDLINSPGGLKVMLDEKDVTQQIRQPEVTKIVSDIAKIKEVRKIMLALQRQFGKRGNSVLDGRDIGTVVFPDADKKFYLDATVNERSRRRYKELIEAGQNLTLDEVKKDLLYRDKIDSTRQIAPLKKAEDAIYIDTTDMTIEQVTDKVLGYING